MIYDGQKIVDHINVNNIDSKQIYAFLINQILHESSNTLLDIYDSIERFTTIRIHSNQIFDWCEVLMILNVTTFPRKIKGLVAAVYLIRNIKLAIKPRLLFIAIPTKPRLSLATIFVDFILHCV